MVEHSIRGHKIEKKVAVPQNMFWQLLSKNVIACNFLLRFAMVQNIFCREPVFYFCKSFGTHIINTKFNILSNGACYKPFTFISPSLLLTITKHACYSFVIT